MTRDELVSTIADIVADCLDIDPSGVRPESKIEEDLGGDSFDLSVIACDVTEELGVDIPDDAMGVLRTVEDFANFVDNSRAIRYVR